MKKIIGIFVFMLMIATAIVSATTVKEINIETTSNEVDVPVWKVGDTWTYNEHYNEIAYRDDGTPGLIWYHNCTSNYTLTKLTQELEHRKTDLAYMRWFHQEKGFVFWLLGRIGFPIPAHFSLATEASFSPANELIPFPLTAGKNGTFPSFTITGHSKVSLYFGLIKLSDSDFSYDVPAQDYMCEMANITVPAGTYEAYNVSTDFYFGSAHNYSYDYYVPEVGYFVKLLSHNDWDDSGKPALNYHHELISTTFKP